MMLYQIGDYTLSADLQRYSKTLPDLAETDDDIKNELGYCKVEYVKAPIGDMAFQPLTLDPDKPYETLNFEPMTNLTGHLAIQTTVTSHCASAEDEASWLRVKIAAPNADLDALITEQATSNGLTLTKQEFKQTKERLLIKMSTPKTSNPATVGALIRNTATIRATILFAVRILELADALSISERHAEFLAFAERHKGFTLLESGWHPDGMTLTVAASAEELEQLASKDLLELTQNRYVATEKAITLLRTHYL